MGLPKLFSITVITFVFAGVGALVPGGLLRGSSHGGPPTLVASVVSAESATGVPAGEEGHQPRAEVLGDLIDCPPTGAGPEDTRSAFEINGDVFEVTGTLSSFDGITAVVAGPSGDVSATLASEFQLTGDLSPGSAVRMVGSVLDVGMTAHQMQSVCEGAGVIDCRAGADPRFTLELSGGRFEATGLLDSLTDGLVRVLGPGLLVEASIDSSTVIEAGLAPGDPVRVRGVVLSESALKTEEMGSACADALDATSSKPAEPREAEDSGAAKCNRGPGGENELRVRAKQAEVEIKRGAVLSSSDLGLTVKSSAGEFSVAITEDTDVQGDLGSASEVTVKGHLRADGSILAEKVKVLCPARVGEDDGEGRVCSDDDENRGHGNDCDHDDEDNPGQGGGNHGADDGAGEEGDDD